MSPTILIIRDGWGRNPHPDHNSFNAVHLARTPVDDRLAGQWPSTLVRTCGVDVGLPPGTMGNSEVGHQNIGAGRVVDQEVMRISRSIESGDFFEKPALLDAIAHVRGSGGRLHLLGLVSDGQVHSDLAHLLALLDLAKRTDLAADRVLVHAITDGRDTQPRGGLDYVATVEGHCKSIGVGRVASVIGRFWAMDRDHRWERVAAAYGCLTGRDVDAGPDSPAVRTAASSSAAIQDCYDTPIDPGRGGDEFIVPTMITDPATGTPLPRIADGDAVVFFNFRGDRPREITKAFVLDDDAWSSVQGGGFARGPRLAKLFFCAMTGYESGLPVSAIVFDKPPKMESILGAVVAEAGLTQFRCAETEKYPHVTFFFNDYREEPFPGEGRGMVPSPRDVPTYDLKPRMSAEQVCATVLGRIEAEDGEPLIVVNFANPDMVGHTGKLEAVIEAVECVDACVGRIVDAALARGGGLVVTADHGNAEQMWDPAHDCPHTAHTTYDVPLFVIGERWKGRTLRAGGRLADLAPTLLEMMGLERPAAMTGESLLGG